MTTPTRPNPAQAFTELLDATGELRAIEQRRAEQVARRERATRELYSIGVSVRALAELTGLSEETIKRLVAPARAPERRQNCWLSALFLMLSAYAARSGDEQQRQRILAELDRQDTSGATSAALRRWLDTVDASTDQKEA